MNDGGVESRGAFQKCFSNHACHESRSVRVNESSDEGADGVVRTLMLQEAKECKWYRQPLSSGWAWLTQEIEWYCDQGEALSITCPDMSCWWPVVGSTSKNSRASLSSYTTPRGFSIHRQNTSSGF